MVLGALPVPNPASPFLLLRQTSDTAVTPSRCAGRRSPGAWGGWHPWVRRGHDAVLTKGWLLRALILQERPCRAHSPAPAEGGCSPAAFLSRPGQIFEGGLIIRVPIILALQSDRPRCRGDSCPYPHHGFAGSIPGPTSVPVLSAPGCCPRGVPSAGTMSAAAAWSQLGMGPRARRATGTRSYG